MPEIHHQQSTVLRWKERLRRQQIFGALVIAVLLAALLYGWLYVFGWT
jgi:hypothetical protein